jgi:hypothetical protein
VVNFTRENPNATLTDIRNGTVSQYDYNDLRMIIAHQTRAQSGAETGTQAKPHKHRPFPSSINRAK